MGISPLCFNTVCARHGASETQFHRPVLGKHGMMVAEESTPGEE